MENAAVEEVVSLLEDDAFRRGGSVTYDRVLSLCSKHKLPPDAIAVVRRKLRERDVAVEMPDAGDEGSQENIGGETEPTTSDGGADQEPSEGVAPEVVRDILASYYHSAAQFERLTREDELALARRIHAGRAAAEHLAANPGVHVDGLAELVSDGKRARDTLIEANLLLVPFVAKTIEGRDQLPLEDLLQDGNLGLMRAAERFEGGHEAKFSTYACWWIWSFMKRALIDRGRLVRLPVHFAERIPGLLKARRALARERDGVPPTVTELAEHLGWRVEHVIFALQSIDNPVSIDAPSGDGLSSIAERLVAPPEAQPDVAAGRRQEQRILATLVESLGKRMAHVLKERFGLGGRAPRTLEQVGVEMGVTRERIRQIEAKALKKLRHPSRRKFWALFGASQNADSGEAYDENEDSDD